MNSKKRRSSKADRRTRSLTTYEEQQVAGISAWLKEEPGAISKASGVVVEPLAWLVRQVVPDTAMIAALEGANSAGQWMADKDDILRDAKVKNIKELLHKDLELSDQIADSCHNWAIGIATAEGAATGAGGIFTAPLDIPAIITIATRTIHKIGLCYGFESKTEADKRFVLGILSAAGANSIGEKVVALTTLRILERLIMTTTWKAIAEKAAAQQLSREGAIIAIRNLTKQLGINLTKRRVLAAIPLIGAAIGGSVNAWYINDVGWAARRCFQQKWLLANKKTYTP